MKKLLPFLALLLFVGCAMAADIITATLTFTNAPTNGAVIVVNGTTRNWTNNIASSPATLIATNATPGGSATNFFLHIARYPFSSSHIPGRVGSNVVTIRGGVGGAMAVTASGYASVTYATNTASPFTFLVRVPITEEPASNQTAIASLLVRGQSDSSTNSFSTNSTAMANYATLTTGQTLSNKTVRASVLENSRITNGILHVTNGFGSNLVLHTPTMTNGANYGNAFRSPGSGSNSEQFGVDAEATNTQALAIGYTAKAYGVQSVSIGAGAQAIWDYSTAIGSAAFASEGAVAFGRDSTATTNSVALGTSASASKPNTIAIGNNAFADHENSTAVGNGATTTTSNQVVMGSSSHTVLIAGEFQATTATNNTWTGTNTLQGSFATPVYALGSLANGNNAGVLFSNVWNQISGPSAAFTINGIAHGNGNRNGLVIEIENPTGYQMTIADNSGVDPTAANRIRTGTGADITITNNPGWVRMIYDASAARWKVQFRSN